MVCARILPRPLLVLSYFFCSAQPWVDQNMLARLDVSLDAVPVSGRVVLRVNEPKPKS